MIMCVRFCLSYDLLNAIFIRLQRLFISMKIRMRGSRNFRRGLGGGGGGGGGVQDSLTKKL